MTKPTQVYMVSPSLESPGGITSVLHIYFTNYKDALKATIDMKSIETYSGDNRIKDIMYFSSSLMKVFWACLKDRDSIFHLHSASVGSFLRKSTIARLCGLFKKKFIYHIHGARFDSFMESSKPSQKRHIISLLSKAERIIVLSDSWKKYFSQYIPPEKLLVICNPCENLLTEYKKKNNPRVNIIFLGRLGHRKGSYDLVEAVRLIKDSNFVLNLYGDGEVEETKALVAKYRLGDRVIVHGWVHHSKVREIHDAGDILVLPSYAEGLPMSILEAIGNGLPVVSTNVGGIPEAVTDGENGFIISPGDIPALSQRLEALINDSSLRERMGRKGLEIARENFSTQSIGKQLEKLYKELCK